MLEPLTCTKSVAQCELLVVDDQQAQLKSLQQLLHISGYTNVTLASGGDEAIRILQNNTPQLILLDLLMPDTNGLDVIAFHHQAGLDSEIIVISGETSFPWVKEAMRLGAFDFICKPYKPEELLITIVKALDRFQEKKKILKWRNNTHKDINSHSVGVLAIGQDITERKRAEDELRASQEKYRMLTENIKDVAWTLDTDTLYFTYVSPSVTRLRGYTPEEIISKPLDASLAEGQRAMIGNLLKQRVADFLSGRIAADDFFTEEVLQPCKDGTAVWTEVITHYLRDPATGNVVLQGVTRDITERKQAQLALHDAEQNAQYQLSFHRIAAETAAALATAASDAEFDTAINQCLQRLGLLFGADRSYVFQFSDDLAYTTNTHEWCADGIAPEMDNLQNLPMGDKSWLTTRLLRDGVLYARVADLLPEAASLKAEFQRQEVQSFLHATTRGAQGKLAGFIGFDSVLKERSWRDDELDMIQTIAGVVGSLSVSKQSEKKLRASHKKLQAKNSLLDSLSKTDQLTGIANRRKTQQVIDQEIDRFNRYKKPFCLFLFDIDHFKAVNDNHGHEVGDQVLVELVGLVQSVIRRTDTLGRWGGEEFILVCPETSLPTAQTIADKICSTVREYKFTRGLSITLSIGVSEIQSGATLKEILVEVDRKMYLAKQKGRDRVES